MNFGQVKSLMVCVMLVVAAPAMAADYMRLDLNRGASYLNECGGTVEAKSTSQGFGASDQVNLVVRNVKNCSHFILETTGQEYKLQGPQSDRGGSFSLSAGRLNMGWNQLNLTVRSSSGKHNDHVAIWVNVVPQSAPVSMCNAVAVTQAKVAAGSIFGVAYVSAERVSHSGNLVSTVTVVGYGEYEVTMTAGCNTLNVARK